MPDFMAPWLPPNRRPLGLSRLVQRIPEAPQATPGLGPLRPESEQEVTLTKGLPCAGKCVKCFSDHFNPMRTQGSGPRDHLVTKDVGGRCLSPFSWSSSHLLLQARGHFVLLSSQRKLAGESGGSRQVKGVSNHFCLSTDGLSSTWQSACLEELPKWLMGPLRGPVGVRMLFVLKDK